VISSFEYALDPLLSGRMYLQSLAIALLSFANCTCSGGLEIPEARIGGQLDLSGAILVGQDGGHAMIADGSQVNGGVFFRKTNASGTISLLGVSASGPIVFRDAQLSSPSGISLYGDGLKTDNNLQLDGAFAALGMVQLYEIHVGGILNCNGGSFDRGAGPAALHVSGSTIGGKCYMNIQSVGGVSLAECKIARSLLIGGRLSSRGSDRSSQAMPLDMASIQVGGDILMSALTVDTDTDYGINLTHAAVKGSISLAGRSTCNAAVVLTSASAGTVTLSDATITATATADALIGQHSRLASAMTIGSEFSCVGGVDLYGMTVEGSVECLGKITTDPAQQALILTQANIKGNVIMRAPMSVDGQVVLLGTKIGGQLVCWGARFHGDSAALSCEGTSVANGAFFDSGCRVEGGVSLCDAKIGSLLTFDGSEIVTSVPGRTALALERVTVGGALVLRRFECQGVLCLSDASVHTLVDDLESWPSSILLGGFAYKRLFSRSPLAWMNACSGWRECRSLNPVHTPH
jgi:hypothetical protein